MNPNLLQRQNWHGGQLLAFSGIEGKTDYKNSITAKTSFKNPGIEIKFPGECKIKFSLLDHGDFVIAGDFFDLKSSQGNLKGVFLDAYHLLIEGSCEITEINEQITSYTEGDLTLIGATANFDKTKVSENLSEAITLRGQWLKKQTLPEDLTEVTQRTAVKFLSIMKTQIYSPENQIKSHWSTPDRWPHKDMWLWDSVFHAIGWRHIDKQISKELIDAVLDTQKEDGYIAHQMTPDKVSAITQPPILAYGVDLVNEYLNNKEWIKEVYPKLCRYVEWDFKNRDTDGAGLVEWFIEGNTTCRSGESGMDNSPRFDTATQLDAVDFNSFLALEYEILSKFASILELKEDANKWKNKHQELNQLIRKKLWSEEEQFFVDYDVDINKASPVIASSGFLPLICGAATKQQAEILAKHLNDPNMFATSFPISSIAVKDCEHYSKDMWRGPTWININWLIAKGFERYGLNDVALSIRKRTSEVIEQECERFGVSFEYYDDRNEIDPPELLRKGQCSPEESPYFQVLHDYGWTATLYIDLLFTQKDL